MRKKCTLVSISVFLLMIIMTAPVFAASTTLYCDGFCHTRRVFNRVDTVKQMRHSVCNQHTDCALTKRYQLFDWRCSVCNYGRGAYSGEEFLEEWHTPLLR